MTLTQIISSNFDQLMFCSKTLCPGKRTNWFNSMVELLAIWFLALAVAIIEQPRSFMMKKSNYFGFLYGLCDILPSLTAQSGFGVSFSIHRGLLILASLSSDGMLLPISLLCSVVISVQSYHTCKHTTYRTMFWTLTHNHYSFE